MKYTITTQLQKILLTGLLIIAIGAVSGYSQGTKQKPKTGDKLVIDSLQNVIFQLSAENSKLDSLFDNERFVNADLRDQMIKLDDYRQKLEGNVNSFKGENLKLNQSNRILIVFNSLVAILLLVTLVFFLRRIGKKKNQVDTTQPFSVIEKSEAPGKFMNFEDKIQQLERLGKLREKGLLSEEEFNAEKHLVLGK